MTQLSFKYDRGNFFDAVEFTDGDETFMVTDPFSFRFRDFNDFVKSRQLTKYVVRQHEEGRPDLIAYKHYGMTMLWWVVLQVNRIVDPFSELVMGVELRLPLLVDIEEFLNSQRAKTLSNRTVMIDDKPIG